MAVLYISEYSGYLQGGVQVPVEPAIATQTVAIGGSSTQSAAFNANTRLVRLETDAICSISFGQSPTVTTSNARMAANSEDYFEVQPGHKVAVITNT
jgi:hypothetical protein